MAVYYITFTNWSTFLNVLLRQYSVYGLFEENTNLFCQKLTPQNILDITVNRYRAVQPVKSFLFPVKEEVTHEPSLHANVFIGAKACDLGHLLTTDAIFSGGATEDPYYRIRRDNTILISADCDDLRPSCFCTLMEGRPYPLKGFDINLSPTRSGFLAETGSESGEALVRAHTKLFQEPRPEHLDERRQSRENITRRVQENNRRFNWTNPKKIIENDGSVKIWEQDIAGTCVECDACRFTCGTCYCFLLAETVRKWDRIRTWDSCQSVGYGRVAGGANPRRTRGERLRNLYTCKLQYRRDNFGVYACTGCGRCIDVCQGKIDIRESLQKIHDEQTAVRDKK
jgi:ferredoxin